MKIAETQAVLEEIIALLRENGAEDWTRSFEGAHALLDQDPAAARSDIKSLFGGMGSFNDLVLHRNKQPLIEENRKLAAEKDKLYKLCSPPAE